MVKMEARFLLSRSKVIEQYNIVKSLADEVSYSFKTNTDVAKILESETNCSFSVESIKYIRQISEKSRVWFFTQAVNNNQLQELFNAGVNSFVVDNPYDLRTLLEFVSNHNKQINLLLRMRIKELTVHTGKHFVFGMPSKEINRLVPELRRNTHIKKLGIHFHRKTQNTSEWSLKRDISEVLDKGVLESIDIMNIGGGLPCRYKNYKLEFLNSIFDRILEFKDWLNKNFSVKMIIEPGRFIAAPAVKLEAEIIAIYDNNIIINCSVFNSAMDTFVLNTRLLVENELDSSTGKPYVIKGCTNDSMDIFRYKVYLKNPRVGDKIIFINAGAYNYATDFCGLEKLKTIIVD